MTLLDQALQEEKDTDELLTCLAEARVNVETAWHPTGHIKPSSRVEISMTDASQIREHMEVVGSDREHVGTVDLVEGQRIKLAKTDSGRR
jgi:hypothetical protein